MGLASFDETTLCAVAEAQQTRVEVARLCISFLRWPSSLPPRQGDKQSCAKQRQPAAMRRRPELRTVADGACVERSMRAVVFGERGP